MKAIGLTKYLPITDSASLVDLELPKPQAQGHDLLVGSINAATLRKAHAQIETGRTIGKLVLENWS